MAVPKNGDLFKLISLRRLRRQTESIMAVFSNFLFIFLVKNKHAFHLQNREKCIILERRIA